MTTKVLQAEIVSAGKLCGLPVAVRGQYCHAGRDGDCNWQHCPQNRDGEPELTGRHCPIDIHVEERGHQ